MLVRHQAPQYPAAARRDRVEGLVLLRAMLDRDGRVVEPIRVLKSVPLLDEAAIAALRTWRFAPARDAQGHAVASVMDVPVRFVLQ